MEKYGAKRARHYTLLTGNALFLINLTITILNHNSISGAILPAFWHLTLSADNRHPDDGMGINNHHPYATLLGIIDSESIDGTDHLAEPTTRAPLRNNSQSSGHKNPPYHLLLSLPKRFYSKKRVCQ